MVWACCVALAVGFLSSAVLADVIETEIEEVVCTITGASVDTIEALVPDLGTRLIPVSEVTRVLTDRQRLSVVSKILAGHSIPVEIGAARPVVVPQDEVVLRSGQRVIGSITEMDQYRIVIQNDSAGTAYIPINQVSSVKRSRDRFQQAGVLPGWSSQHTGQYNPLLADAGRQLQDARTCFFVGLGLQAGAGLALGLLASDSTTSTTVRIAVPLSLELAALALQVVAWQKVGEAGSSLLSTGGAQRY